MPDEKCGSHPVFFHGLLIVLAAETGARINLDLLLLVFTPKILN
jgi:hypothetical protein